MLNSKLTPITCPFRVLIDTAEQHNFSFQGLKADAAKGGRPLLVEIEWRCLSRHPNSLGDYSLDSDELSGIGRCHVERKSLADAHSTILGFGDGHRARFEKELANLAEIEAGLVVVECSFELLLQSAPEWGKKTKSQNAKTLMRSVLAYQQDYKVPWLFAGSRLMAEISTFRFLERWYEKNRPKRGRERRPVKEVAEEIDAEVASL